MSNDNWDDIPSKSGQYVKWTNIGQTVAGTVLEKRTGRTMDGDPVPELVISTSDGDLVVTASQANLHSKLLALKNEIKPGIAITITFTAELVVKNGKAKQFNVQLAPAAKVAADDLI